jgi:hypothetical protein
MNVSSRGMEDPGTTDPDATTANVEPATPRPDDGSTALVKWTIVMAVATIALAVTSMWAIFETRRDARELLNVQISNELDKQFDSTEFRGSRARFAAALSDHREPSDYRVLDFLEKVAVYVKHGAIDEDTSYSVFSYAVERYWPASKDLILKFRSIEHDSSYYSNLEEWYEHLAKSGKLPDEAEVQAFLKEETELE